MHDRLSKGLSKEDITEIITDLVNENAYLTARLNVAKHLLEQAADMLRGHNTGGPDEQHPNGYCVLCGVDSSQCTCELREMCRQITAFLERK